MNISRRHLLKPITRTMPVHFKVIGPTVRYHANRAFGELYRAINFQDRLINQAWTKGKFVKEIRWGVRHGAAAGSILGPALFEFGDDIEDGRFPTRDVPPTGQYSKTRYRSTRRNCPSNKKSNRYYQRR